MDQPLDLSPEPAGQWADSADLNNVYREVCAEIRATDETSLKLLATVPLATGVGIALLVRVPGSNLPSGARLLLSVFAALVTFAIYRWERKNIATCSHFRRWAAALERSYFRLPCHAELRPTPDDDTLPHDRIRPPRSFGLVWNKTEAVRLLYWTAIIGWLSAGAYTVVS
jgi:hypothetical protein